MEFEVSKGRLLNAPVPRKRAKKEVECAICSAKFPTQRERNKHVCPVLDGSQHAVTAQLDETKQEGDGEKNEEGDVGEPEQLPYYECPWSPNVTAFMTVEGLNHHIQDVHTDPLTQPKQLHKEVEEEESQVVVPVGVGIPNNGDMDLPLVIKVDGSGDAGDVFARSIAAAQSGNNAHDYERVFQQIKQQIAQSKHFQPFLCSQCGLLISTSDECRKHLIDYHMAPSDHANKLNSFTIGNGTSSASSGSGRSDKENKDKELNTFECSICNKVFGDKTQLFEHSVDTHRRKVLFECTTCSKIFMLKVDLNRHLAVHQADEEGGNDDKSYDCKYCGKKFAFDSYLRRHMATHTGEGYFRCDMCPLVFRSQGQMALHKVEHTGQKAHTCSICDKEFAYKSYLDRHTNTHTQAAALDCTKCYKSFSVPTALAKHMKLVHDEHSLHRCPVCDKKFMFPSYLERHMNVHMMTKEQECPVCSKRFGLRTALLDHLKAHFPPEKEEYPAPKPHACGFCNARYKHESNLDRHIRSRHQ